MHTLSARALRDSFIKGERSAVAITQHFLNRIDQHDDKIGAFLKVLHERALNQAARLDAKRVAGEKLGKLAGIPVALKDNINVDGEITTCGSKFLTNFKAPFSATVTHLIEAEDGILIGKTNLDEFAMGSSTEHSALKKTRNPWNLKCVPGGSSGGSAAAVSAGFAPLALGSDTGGSVRLPASLCGLVGFKPTYGRVSRYGLVAYASSLDQISPFGANTADVAMFMEVIGKHCDKDSTSLNIPADQYTFRDNLKGMTVGVPWQFVQDMKPESRKLFEESIENLKSLGCTIVDIDLSILKYAIATYYILATAEASTNLARFDGVRYGVRAKEAKTLDQVYDLSKEQGFGAEVKRRILLGTFVLSAGYQDAYYRKAQKIRTLMKQRFSSIFETCNLIAMPTSVGTAFEAGAIQDPIQMYLEDIYTIGVNLAGLPAVSVPAGFIKKMPFGLQLIGPQKGDVTVLQAAEVFERHLKLTPTHPEL